MVGLKKENAFEGWFCKVDDRESGLMCSVIWGYSTHGESKHAFLQFQDNLDHGTAYVSYPIEELEWDEDPFVLRIGKNELSKDGMTLDFVMKGIPVKGTLHFGDFSPINRSLLKPNIMGWLTYLPNECNHSIISMHHTVKGRLQIGDRSWVLQDADAYIEKDWGTGFPKEYVWVQASDRGKTSVVFSYATVPMLGQYAKGFFLVLHHEGEEYRFSSIEGSKILDFDVSEDAFSVTIQKRGIRLTLQAEQFNPVSLASPAHGEMSSRIKESLDGKIELELERDERMIVHFSSQRASIDVHF